jgi:hypothetical protein
MQWFACTRVRELSRFIGDEVAMNNCSIAKVPRERAYLIATSNDRMFDRDGARDEQPNDRPQQ